MDAKEREKVSEMERNAKRTAREYKPFGATEHWERDFAHAYMEGARQLATFIGLFYQSVKRELETPKNEYERGQRDGVKWAAETVQELLSRF